MSSEQAGRSPGFLGSLREALAAASREETAKADPETATVRLVTQQAGAEPQPVSAALVAQPAAAVPSAAEAARTARGGAPNVPPLLDRHVEFEAPPTTRVVRSAARTQIVRGKPKIERGELQRDPVVGWLVVVGGPGLGAFRPIYEGNNAMGRAATQRIAIDFGDDAISAEEQAYIRYDSSERTFLLVPNLAKANIVSINNKRPTAAVPLAAMDVITMGRTQLAFVPFCGPDFDWSELNDANA